MGQQLGVVHAEVGVLVGVDMRGVLFLASVVLDPEVGLADAGEGHPVIVTLVVILEVHVVAVRILISWFGGVIIYN